MSFAHPKITVVTGYDESYRSIAEASVPNKKDYCDRHGYKLRVYCREAYDGRCATWLKIPWLFDSLPYGDWLFWSDADSLVADFSRRLEGFLNPDPDVHLVISEDLPRPEKLSTTRVNTGHFFLRCCEWSEILLDTVWANTPYKNRLYHEQSALEELIYSRAWVSRHTKVVPYRMFNSFASVFEKGEDFIIHFAGEPNRPQRMREWLQCNASLSPCSPSA